MLASSRFASSIRLHRASVSDLTTDSDYPPSKYLTALFRHFILVICIIAVSLLAAFVVTVSLGPTYQSKGSLEIQAPPSYSFSNRDGDANGSLLGQSYETYLDTQKGILESDTLVRKAAAHLHFSERLNSLPSRGIVSALKPFLAIGSPKRGLSQDDAFEIARRGLSVRQARLNSLVEVVFNSPDAHLSAEFVNTLIDEYGQQTLDSRWQMVQRTSAWLGQHLAETRKKLELSEDELNHYGKENGIVLVANTNVTQDRLRQLQQDLLKTQSERIQRQSQMETAAAANPDSIPQLLDDGASRDYRAKIADLQRQIAEKSQVYTPTSQQVRALQVQLNSLQASSDKQRTSVLTRLTSDFAVASRAEKMLTAAYQDQEHLVSDQESKMVRYATLKHEVDVNRLIYESLLQKTKESTLSVALQATNVRVVDVAQAPRAPYKPNMLINLGSGLLFGLLLSGMAVLLLEKSNGIIRTPSDFPRHLGVPGLGVVPSFTAKLKGSNENNSMMGLFRAETLSGSPVISPRRIGQSSIPWVCDSFRALMTSMVFRTSEISTGSLFVVTSASPGEGKTTTACNLAAALAKTGRRLLLVDSNTTSSELHRWFSIKEGPGYSDFVLASSGKLTNASQIDRFVQTTPIANLSVMTGGEQGGRVLEVMCGVGFADALNVLKSQFDVILIDAQPVLRSSEARVLSRLADGVLLVSRARFTRVADLICAQQQILMDSGVLLGVVLNDTKLERTGSSTSDSQDKPFSRPSLRFDHQL